MQTYSSTCGDQSENCSSKFLTALGMLCHLSPILVIRQLLVSHICLNYYLTLQGAHSYKWNWLYFTVYVDVLVKATYNLEGDVLVKATYNLEGDVPLALSTYEHIFLSTFATTVHYPNTADICTLTVCSNHGLYQ